MEVEWAIEMISNQRWSMLLLMSQSLLPHGDYKMNRTAMKMTVAIDSNNLKHINLNSKVAVVAVVIVAVQATNTITSVVVFNNLNCSAPNTANQLCNISKNQSKATMMTSSMNLIKRLIDNLMLVLHPQFLSQTCLLIILKSQ